MKGLRPSVFVSSTCYDLGPIRRDLYDFISDIGYDALMSESDSFPVDPSLNAEENCIRNVKERADIMILIIGCRYGSITNSGKSITNLEYLEACIKGIPIYIFVARKLIYLLPMWKNNPENDYSYAVDTTLLFNFIDELHDEENKWVSNFEDEKEIISKLKIQFGYLFHDSLQIRRRMYSGLLSNKLSKLEGAALKYVLEQPIGWELKLLGKIMDDACLKFLDIKRDLTYGLVFGKIRRLESNDEVIEWITSKNVELLSIAIVIHSWVYDIVPDAIGNLGEVANNDLVVYAGERYGNIYQGVLDWGLEFKSILVDLIWEPAINSLSKLWMPLIGDLELFCLKFNEALNDIQALPKDAGGKPILEISLDLTTPDLTEFDEELEIVRTRLGIKNSEIES